MKNFNFYVIILTIAALLLASCAAFFSVFGLSKLFAGAGLSIIIMASTLELGKVIAVSYLNRFWKDIGWTIRIYLLSGIIILMLLTSLGVYGYLSNAYQMKADQYSIVTKQTEMKQSKKQIFAKQIDNYKDLIKSKNDRMSQLSGIRITQENRLNNLYEDKNYYVANRAEKYINNSAQEIQNINADINEYTKHITILNDSISKIEMEILALNNTNVSAEIGPLRYITELSNTPMNKITNILILLIIFVFDPMAMSFVIAINKVIDMKRKQKESYLVDSVNKLKEEYSKSQNDINNKFEKLNKNHGLIVESQVTNI